MTDIEIPYEKDRNWRYRLFEILPAVVSWCMLALPFVLSVLNVTLAAVFVLLYLLINFCRGIGGGLRAMQGLRVMEQHKHLPWKQMLRELERGEIKDPRAVRPGWHRDSLLRRQVQANPIQPSEVVHAIIVATYKELREVLEPTLESVLKSDYDMKKVLLILAYEERGGAQTEKLSNELVGEFKDRFMDMFAVKHPADIPGEIIGKGGNVTYAGRELEKYLKKHDIDPLRVMVTTLDADNRPHPQYLNTLTYAYTACEDPVHTAFQPVTIYTNNIWDAPAPARVVATGSTFFNVVLSLRQHALRNFSSHAQPMAGLLKTDFWSVRTIVEDGHQFWRSYFAFDGNYIVYPLLVPIYQDAVLTDKYTKTLKAQFVQLRRWAYGASDIAYVVQKGFFTPNKVPRLNLIAKLARLTEGHITWAVGPLLILFAGFVPALVNHDSYAANELPIIVSNVQTVALIIALASVFLAFKTLPPKPARYKNHRSVFMLLQWLLLPVTTVVYNAFAALYSQTRLALGLYFDKFDVTEKAVVLNDKSTVTRESE